MPPTVAQLRDIFRGLETGDGAAFFTHVRKTEQGFSARHATSPGACVAERGLGCGRTAFPRYGAEWPQV